MQRELHLTFQLMQRSVIESLWTKVVCGLLPYQGYSPTIFRGRATEADLEVTVKGQLENSNSRRQAQACGGADRGAGTALHLPKG